MVPPAGVDVPIKIWAGPSAETKRGATLLLLSLQHLDPESSFGFSCMTIVFLMLL